MHTHAEHYGRAFAIGVGLNLVFVAVEAFYGWTTGSLALLGDAGHNLGDVAGLLLAWAAWGAARLQPDMRHSYGWHRGSILAGFINALVLIVAMLWLAWESMQRLRMPAGIDAGTVVLVAAIGVVINTATAWLFLSGRHHDLNLRGAFLHMAADALVSLGVVLAALLYQWRGWVWIDPALSLVIVVVVLGGTWSLFKKSLHLLFDGVPEGIDLSEVTSALLAVPGVAAVHDLHVWALGTAAQATTAHLVCAEGALRETILAESSALLRQRFGIGHVTLQLESAAEAARCPQGSVVCHF